MANPALEVNGLAVTHRQSIVHEWSRHLLVLHGLDAIRTTSLQTTIARGKD